MSYPVRPVAMLLLLLAALPLLPRISSAEPPATVPAAEGLPPAVVPQGWGVNIHFTTPAPGEMDRFAEGGFRFIRMDFSWAGTEKKSGVYDFSAYDRLWESLHQVGARPLFILDYGNDLYQKGAPTTPEARAAFARFAAAAAGHFAGKGVIWEIWNEPNGAGFWPNPDGVAYAKLAIGAARAIHAVDPHATVLAPGAAGFPWDYLEKAFRTGLLDAVDGVSVHPYRGDNPETAALDFARLRTMIVRYAPSAKRNMPMISSEWGYSTHLGGGVSEQTQAAYITRMWLSNLVSGVDLSIFYDWREDGPDPKENEHHFGITHRDPTFSPKPAFIAAKDLVTALRGYSYRFRLSSKTNTEWRLLFQRGNTDDLALVTWDTSRDTPQEKQIPVVRKITADTPEFASFRQLARVHISAGPLAQGMGKPASWRISYDAPGKSGSLQLQVGAPFNTTIPVSGTRAQLAQPRTVLLPVTPGRAEFPSVMLKIVVDGKTLPVPASFLLRRTDVVTLAAAPQGKTLQVSVENPGDTPVKGTLLLQRGDGTTMGKAPLILAAGQLQGQAILPSPGMTPYRVLLRDSAGHTIASTPLSRYRPFTGFPTSTGSDSGFRRIRFVENAPLAPEPLEAVAAPPGGPGGVALRLDYTFTPGWQYTEVAPASAMPMPAGARALVLWVWSDGSGDYLRCRFRDSTGQTFQPDMGRLDGKGWKVISVPLDGTNSGHWGGAGDGVPHGSLIWDCLALVDSTNRAATHSGEILIAAPVYVSQ